MKILLTGGAGFIATHTCVELMAAGHDVVAFADQEDVFEILEDVLPPIFAKYGIYHEASKPPFTSAATTSTIIGSPQKA